MTSKSQALNKAATDAPWVDDGDSVMCDEGWIADFDTSNPDDVANAKLTVTLRNLYASGDLMHTSDIADDPRVKALKDSLTCVDISGPKNNVERVYAALDALGGDNDE